MEKRVPTMRKFKIDSFQKLLDILDRDNFAPLTTCLMHFLHHHMVVIEKVRETLPEEQQGMTNWELLPSTFVWEDDGIDELLQVEMTNSITGEVFTTILTPRPTPPSTKKIN